MLRHSILCLLLFLVILTGCSALYVPLGKQEEIPAFEPKNPVKVALVLGGGGSRGLAHLGAIRELEAAGIRPDLIIGCSSGAIAGALYADAPHLSEIDQLLMNLKRSDLLDTRLLKPRFGLVKGKALKNFMKKNLQSKTFEELQIPLIVIATDLQTGDSVELCHGNIPNAVRASCSFPGVFKPVFLHRRYLIDGGASSPVPVEIAKKYGAKVIIAIDLTEKLTHAVPSHLFGVAKRGMEIMYRTLVAQSLAKADFAIQMDFQDMGMFSDHRNQEIYEEGRQKMREKIPAIKSALEAN